MSESFPPLTTHLLEWSSSSTYYYYFTTTLQESEYYYYSRKSLAETSRVDGILKLSATADPEIHQILHRCTGLWQGSFQISPYSPNPKNAWNNFWPEAFSDNNSYVHIPQFRKDIPVKNRPSALVISAVLSQSPVGKFSSQRIRF